MKIFFNFFFLIFSIILGIRSIAYGIYEVKQNENKAGGIGFTVFCLLTILFCNIVVCICCR